MTNDTKRTVEVISYVVGIFFILGSISFAAFDGAVVEPLEKDIKWIES